MSLFKTNKWLKYVLVFSIITRIILEILFPSLYGDNWMQINSFFNYIDGHGITMNFVDHLNLSEIYYEKLNLWPVGFIFLNLPLWYIFNDISLSVLINNCLFIVLFFWSIYKILLKLDNTISGKFKSIILLFFSIAIMPNRYMGATDLWCLALLFYTFYQTWHIITDFKEFNKSFIKKVIFISLSILLMISLRYTYWLLAFVFPFFIIFYGLIFSKRLIKIGIITAILSILLSTLYIFLHYQYFQQIYPKSVPLMPSLQWESLKVYNSLYFNTLYRDSIVRQFFLKIISPPTGYYIFHYLIQIFSLIIFIPVSYAILKLFKIDSLKKISIPDSNISIFILLSIAVTFVNNITIIYSTLKFGYLYLNDLYPLGYSVVAEVRYFAPSLILLFIFLIITISFFQNYIISKSLTIILYSALSFAILINFYFLYNRFNDSNNLTPKYIHYTEKNIELYKIFLDLKSKHKTVFLPSKSSDIKDLYMANYAHIPEVKNLDWKKIEFKSKDTVKIISYIYSSDTSFKTFNLKIIKKSIKSNIDLVEINIFPNLAN